MNSSTKEHQSPVTTDFFEKKNNNNNICTKWFWMDLVNKPFFRFDALSKVFIVDTTLKTNAGISYSDVFSNFTVFVLLQAFLHLPD